MPLSQNVTSRLYNWKFSQAERYMREELDAAEAVGAQPPYTDEEQKAISGLADLLGNCGHNLGGTLAAVTYAAVAWVLQQPLDAPDDWIPPVLAEMHRAEMRSRNRHPSTGRYGE